jgi:predicted alpha/beta-fold hydrolase
VQDYYDRASVIPHLHRLDMPCLVVSCANDPVVPADIVRWALVEAGGPVSIRWTFGGHLAFAPQVDLGVPGAKTGLEEQVFGWLRNACGPV